MASRGLVFGILVVLLAFNMDAPRTPPLDRAEQARLNSEAEKEYKGRDAEVKARFQTMKSKIKTETFQLEAPSVVSAALKKVSGPGSAQAVKAYGEKK